MKSSTLPSVDCLSVLAPAKINLHLEVLGLRNDGFHELGMVMQSIDLFDQLDFSITNNGEIKLTSNDKNLSNGQDNLIFKAAKLMHSSLLNKSLGVEIQLKKKIPIGAGLAGGSSDAAATLLGLNTLWQVDYSEKQLIEMSAKLGSDVPFCLKGGTQLCFGRGEELEPVKGLDQSMAILLVKDPLVGVSTPWAYGKYRESYGENYLKSEKDFEIRRQFLRDSSWLTSASPCNPPPLRNDLQKVIEPSTPSVRNSLEFLSSLKGVISCAMSGSGPSCFAIFADLDSAKSALDETREDLKSLGLEGWCCSFRPKGTSLIL